MGSRIMLAFGSLGALAWLAACGAAPPPVTPVVTVQAAVARRQALTVTLSGEAVLYPLHQAMLTPKITAPVAAFFVQRGDRVRAGEEVARLENRDLAAAALEAQAAYQQAQAQYQTAIQAAVPQAVKKAQLDLASAQQALAAARRTFENRQTLYRQGALPRHDLDQAQVAYVDAQAAERIAQQQYDALQAGGAARDRAAALGQLTAARARYEAAEAQLGYSIIRSPIGGVVADRPVYPGELATPSTPLMTIMDTSAVVARAHLPQAEAARVKAGDAATILPESGAPVPARVTLVSPALDPGSTTVQVWMRAANPGGRLRPGSTVRFRIQVATVPNALVIPAPALLTAADGSTSVMVIGADHKAHARPVTVGARAGALVQITAGLQAGETVVTTGAYGLDDSTEVRVAAAAPPGS